MTEMDEGSMGCEARREGGHGEESGRAQGSAGALATGIANTVFLGMLRRVTLPA